MDKSYSIHGEEAARRQARAEFLFFAYNGDLERCQKIVEIWNFDLKSPEDCGDYDKRTALHLAASNGCFAVAEWLVENGAKVNVADNFNRTPLDEAIINKSSKVVIELLIRNGGKVSDAKGEIVDIEKSTLASKKSFNIADDWEIDPDSLHYIQKIGEGEFGVVYKATWHGTIVAVKELKLTSSVALGDFKAELDVLQRCHHPHTVQFLGAVIKSKPYKIVTEYMNGGSLEDVFRANYSLSMERAVRIALDCARGMAYLHNSSLAVKIVHRDLKPANLMIGGHKIHCRKDKDMMIKELGVVKITDFGLSRGINMKLDKGHTVEKLTSIQSLRRRDFKNMNDDNLFPKDSIDSNNMPAFKMTGETGSYRYMAPEVFRHEIYNEKVDVYAFAMIFYELLEGVPPFMGMNPVEAARDAALEHMRPTWGYKNANDITVPKEMRELVRECWAPYPQNRPDFLEIIKRIQTWLDKSPKKSKFSLKSFTVFKS